MSFSNQSINAPVPGKPHVKKVGEWWRVSPIEKPYYENKGAWDKAHSFVFSLNSGISAEKHKVKEKESFLSLSTCIKHSIHNRGFRWFKNGRS